MILILNIFTLVHKIPKRIQNIIRVKIYRCKYTIGQNCSFEKIKFRKPSNGRMGKKSVRIGNSVIIFTETVLTAFDNLPITILDGVFINQRCIISPNVFIGKSVSIAHQVLLISDSHKIGSTEKRAGEVNFLPIRIEDGCWIGANSIVLGGVTIGEGCVIAAGSVVNKDCEPNSLYGGVPARLIRKLNDRNH